MSRNADFISPLDTNPYKFRHYDISDFSLFMKGKRVPSEGISLDMDHEKTSVMGYRTLFEEPGIHYLKSGFQITHDTYINGYFILLFDLTTDRGALEGHTSHPGEC